MRCSRSHLVARIEVGFVCCPQYVFTVWYAATILRKLANMAAMKRR